MVEKRAVRFILLSIACSFLSGCFVLIPFIKSDHQAAGGCRTCPLSQQATPVAKERGPCGFSALKNKRPAQDPLSGKVSRLIQQLQNSDPVLRTHAATDLGFLGQRAQAAVPPLSYALRHDRSEWVRRAAAKSLPKISSEQEVIDALRSALRDPNKWVAHSAAGSLKRIEAKKETRLYRKGRASL